MKLSSVKLEGDDIQMYGCVFIYVKMWTVIFIILFMLH